MAIYVYTGRPRQGKTYEMIRIGYQLLKAGERVFSNVKINTDSKLFKKFPPDFVGDFSNLEDRNNPNKLLFYWTNMHEWEHFGKGNILCDEMQRYFNARRWEQLSEETELKLQQHGKDDLNIFGTVQHYRRIDIALRELVEVWHDVTTIWGNADNEKPFLGLKIFRITSVEGIEFFEPYIGQKIMKESVLDIPQSSKIRFFKKKFGKLYDTRQKVGASIPMPLIHKERICPDCNKVLISHA